MTITDEQLLELPFDELAALCATRQDRHNAAVRMSRLADSLLIRPDVPLWDVGADQERSGKLRLRMLAWITFCLPINDAVVALHALGEAIATVARARLVSRVLDTRAVVVRLPGRRLELWWYGTELCLSEYEHNRTPRRLCTFAGHPEDVAAEAVARLLAEAGL